MKVLPINEIIHGDCLKVMESFPDKSIDMILCDLPYGMTACSWDSVIPFGSLWGQYERIIKNNKAIVLFGNQPFTGMLVMSNLKLFKYEWIWDKGVSGSFAIAKYQPLKTHENILVFGNGKVPYNPQMLRRTEPSRIGGVSRSKQGGQEIKYNPDKLSSKKIYTDAFPKSIQYFSPRTSKNDRGDHPTQKPIALFEYLIKTYTQPGEIVLDNCIGSGTTAIACMNTGRNFIGIELEEKYVEISKERIKKHKKLDGRRLFAISELEATNKNYKGLLE